MEQAGFPVEEDTMSASSVVFSFPVKAPESSIIVKEVGAMEQLALWKAYQIHWCEHKPSVNVYQQAPYEDISAEMYEKLLAEMPAQVDWEKLSQFEKEDNTTGSQELACTGGGCDIL